MGVGISLGGLAGAVAKEGGLGIISGSSTGFDEEDFEWDPQKANKRALKREIKKALEIADTEKSGGMIGVNIPYNTEDYREYVRTAVSEGAGAIITGAGLPMTLPGICEREGYYDIALIPVISSLRAARVIIKNWQKKHKK
ncbi:MAG TPA: nitronate monooxygenase, partial [Bacillota bacterium]|nr:nitronate monooxygenase [Bacillota bacterium]